MHVAARVQSLSRYTEPLVVLSALVSERVLLSLPGGSLVLDVLALYLSARFLRTSPFAWAFTPLGSPHRRLESFNRGVSTVHSVAALLSILFFLLWFSRWFEGWTMGLVPSPGAGFRPFLHAGLWLALVSSTLARPAVRHWLRSIPLTPGRILFAVYGGFSLGGALLLILPFSLQPGRSLPLVDGVFLSVSALSVTGLSPVVVSDTFSGFGRAVLLLLIQIGGMGVVALSAGFAAVLRRRMSLTQTLACRELYNLTHIGSVHSFLGRVALVTLAAEGVGALVLYFCLPGTVENAPLQAVFHAVSAFCNAGFSLFPTGFEGEGMVLFKTVSLVLIVVGGLGFPVLFELYALLTGKVKRLSAHANLTLLVTGILLFVGTFALALSDTSANPFVRLSRGFFYSVSARTAGFNIHDLATATTTMHLWLMVLMMVGGGPLSTAGGIKTTTVGVLAASVMSLIKGRRWTQVGVSEIPALVVQKAVTVVALYGMALFIGVVALVSVENLEPWAAAFESISALSTVGLSVGVTTGVGVMGKLILVGLMLVGRLGLVSVVYAGVGRVAPQRFRYAEGDFFVG